MVEDPQSEWQPMDTAPDDGSEFLAWQNGEIYVAKFCDYNPKRLAYRMHSNHIAEHYRVVDAIVDGKPVKARAPIGEPFPEQWRSDWVLWTRNFDINPVCWKPKPCAPGPWFETVKSDQNTNIVDREVANARFQTRVQPWLMECFGHTTANDKLERNHRFLEEAIELVQSLHCTASEAHQLVDYVFGRPTGESGQEVGGVMLTLAALCLANDMDLHGLAEAELLRVWGKIDEIRAKQADKPKHSPLPGAPASPIDQ